MATKQERVVEFVGGPMCGRECRLRSFEPRQMTFLARPRSTHPPFVHVYATPGCGEDFTYFGTRDYEKGDRERIMGTVP